MSLRALLTVIVLTAAPLTAQDRPRPHPVVPPADFRAAIERGTRTATGAPGARYWQQWTEYALTVRLHTNAKRVSGTAGIVYHNNSPDTLRVVFLHLHQNLHAEGAVRNEPQEVTDGVALLRVAAGGRTLARGPVQAGPAYDVAGTILGVRPRQPLAPGARLRLEIDWQFTVPQSGAGRMGWDDDNLFFIAYWYPQMAVYDDVVGWHLDPYLGNAEFYAGFADYDLTIEAPEGWLVRSTGRLTNPEDVLPPPIRARLERAAASDTAVHVLTEADFGPGRATLASPDRPLAWRFVADSVRDVAFSATSASRWDAARSPTGAGWIRVDAVWRADRAPRWRHMWRYAQHSIDFLSRWTGLPYPWPHMTAVEGGGIIGGGMEFPMMTLMGDYNERGDSALYYVTAHELAHMWVPMLISTDEKRYAWMDEGTTSFNENQARKEFFPGQAADAPDRNGYLATARAGLEGEIMRWSDYHYPGPAYGTASYSKPATLLATLRALLGEETFTRAFRTYLARWRYRHPKPWDFFNTFEEVAGRDLDWFWTSWYYETWTLDHGVTVERADGAPVIVVRDHGLAPMPARLTITWADGRTETREVPVDVWLGGAREHRIPIEAGARPVRVDVDAEGVFPDVDRSNNRWEGR